MKRIADTCLYPPEPQDILPEASPHLINPVGVSIGQHQTGLLVSTAFTARETAKERNISAGRHTFSRFFLHDIQNIANFTPNFYGERFSQKRQSPRFSANGSTPYTIRHPDIFTEKDTEP